MLEKIQIKVRAVSEIIGNQDVGIIIVTDNEETMQIAIVCDDIMKREIHRRLSHEKICNTMLPETLVNILRQQDRLHYEIIINDISDGDYRAMLVNTETYQPLSMRASDAILLHVISHIPLFATLQLMKRQAVPVMPGTAAMAIPYNALTDKMLEEALEKAIELERYEMASTIRDELKRRGKLPPLDL